MALGRTRAVGLRGIDGFLVEVEADVSPGLPHVTMSGLADRSCTQSPDRVKAAAAHSGVPIPQRRITLNLSPASVPKAGAAFDLGIAVATLAASGVVADAVVRDVVHIGELALDGTVRPVRGVLSLVLAAARAGCRHVVVPLENAAEARLVTGMKVHPVADLRELVARYTMLARGQSPVPVLEPEPAPGPASLPGRPDLRDVVGQSEAREALEIAAAGGHHVCLVGPPGAGKTMLAERLPTILPDLGEQDSIEVTAIASVLGTLADGWALSTRPPFVAPHHSSTMAAIVGGGGAQLRPGAITAAHRGVLFLDEAPEFGSRVLQSLRQPLESGYVVVSRARETVRFPSRFQLVLAANPCPCGHASGKGKACTCSSLELRRYAGRLGGPLIDRVDIQLNVEAPSKSALVGALGESSAVVAGRVVGARLAQRQRLAPLGWTVNAQVPGSALRHGPLALPPASRAALDRALEIRMLSLRGYDRCLRLAWTLADCRGRAIPTDRDVGEALALRERGQEAA